MQVKTLFQNRRYAMKRKEMDNIAMAHHASVGRQNDGANGDSLASSETSGVSQADDTDKLGAEGMFKDVLQYVRQSIRSTDHHNLLFVRLINTKLVSLSGDSSCMSKSDAVAREQVMRTCITQPKADNAMPFDGAATAAGFAGTRP